jgi:hypothetical protein
LEAHSARNGIPAEKMCQPKTRSVNLPRLLKRHDYAVASSDFSDVFSEGKDHLLQVVFSFMYQVSIISFAQIAGIADFQFD